MWRIARVAGIVAIGIGLSPGTAREAPLAEGWQAKKPSPLLGVMWNKGAASLVAVDPRSLRPLPGRMISLDRSAGAWAFSPNRTSLALGGSCQIGLGLSAGIEFIDVARFRRVGCLWLGNSVATTWPEQRRLLTVTCCPVAAVLVDPVRRRVLARSSIEGQLAGAAKAGRGLVLLLGSGGLGRLVVVDERGAVRSAPLELPVGLQPREATFVQPGLAVDSVRGRAFVVPAAGAVAEVSLDTLAVAYHELREPVSFRGRLAAWLQPAAQAKELPGTSRTAAWLGDGRLAVTGLGGPGGPEQPAGLALVDIGAWTIRKLDGGIDSVTVSQSRIVATGPRAGVAFFDLDGRLLHRRFGGRWSSVELIHRGLVYAHVSGESRLRVLELATGRQFGRRAAPLPELLLDSSG